MSKAFDFLSWKHPKQLSDSIGDILGGEDNFKSAMLLGSRNLGSVIECDYMYVGLLYLSPGTYYPTHAHEAVELYHTLLGSTLWGPSSRHLRLVEPGDFVLHPSCYPHAFQVSNG